MFGRAFDNPGVTVTGGRLYLTWQINLATAAVPQFELARVDQVTGAVEATRLLVPGRVGTPLAASGWLWVQVAELSASESLLWLNPVGLARTGELLVNGGSYESVGRAATWPWPGTPCGWRAGDRLLRVSLTTGQVIAAIPLPGAYTSGVAASRAGTVLVVSEADDSGI